MFETKWVYMLICLEALVSMPQNDHVLCFVCPRSFLNNGINSKSSESSPPACKCPWVPELVWWRWSACQGSSDETMPLWRFVFQSLHSHHCLHMGWPTWPVTATDIQTHYLYMYICVVGAYIANNQRVNLESSLDMDFTCTHTYTCSGGGSLLST